ncbi:MAG: hypothetical protein PHW13_00520 [Methylococcales bacterium]|nr:hypothetical protein [Methylococcales bacterium]
MALRETTPEAVIAAMYDLSELSEVETALLSVFSLLPAEFISYASLEALLPNLAGQETALLDLSQKGWLDRQDGTEFKISPVVQEIVLRKNQPRLLEDGRGLIKGLINKLEYEPSSGHMPNADYQQAGLFAHYDGQLVLHLDQADEDLAILCERLGNYQLTLCNLPRALRYFADHAKLSQALHHAYPEHVGFKNGLAVAYIKLGEFYQQTSQLQPAKDYYRQAEQLLAELVKQSPAFAEFQNNHDWVTARLAEL